MRILVVEDEPNVASALDAGLTAEGFGVDVTEDGKTGLWMAREHDYAVIVLDVMLPQMNGYVVCQTLREEGNTTPILMLTAKDGVYDQAEGLDTGADDYLTKPFSFVVLTAHIRALIRRGKPRTTNIGQVIGDITIDDDRKTCTRGGVTVELTPRELSLLGTLASDPGRVLTKQYLLDQVWGPDFDGGTNVVEVYVGYLRRKLARPDLTQRIQTVHGHGYRLIP